MTDGTGDERGAGAGRPLSGIRVVDATTVYAGPTCTQILAILGADVVKVESITQNKSRGGHNFPDNDPGEVPWERSGFFIKRNLGKRAITLELQTPQGQEIFKRLVAGAHVVIESYRPGVMDRFGLGYEVLRAVKPDVIMVSLSGWGQEGPWRSYGAYGFGLDPAGGMAYLTGYPDGGPVRAGISYMDPLSGLFGAGAVLTALHHWKRTGEGQHVDLSEAEVGPMLVADGILEYSMNGRIRPRMGNGHLSMAPHGIYPCRSTRYDNWIAIACRDDRDWAALRQAMGDPAWSGDPALATAEGRYQRRDELDARLREWTAGFDKFELTRCLQAVGVPAGPVLVNKELLLDPHLRERGFFFDYQQPFLGPHRVPRQFPVRFDGQYYDPLRPSPMFGEHNREVLCGELGLSEAEYRALQEAGVIGDRPLTRASIVFDLEDAERRGAVAPGYDADHREILGLRWEGAPPEA